MSYTTAQDALRGLVEAYYLRRDLAGTLGCVTDDIEWIGTEEREVASGKAALQTLLEADLAAWPDAFDIEMATPLVQPLGPDAALLTVEGHQVGLAGSETDAPAKFSVRATVCAVRGENGWLIKNVHTSVPNLTTEKMTLERELDTRSKMEATLMAGIPGGIAIYRLKKDGRVATDYVSESLARMCGYTAAEFLAYLREDACVNLLPADVPGVMETVGDCLAAGKPISVRYHIYSKQRALIFIRLDANVIAFNQQADADDIATLYAVHTVVSEEARLLIERQKEMEEFVNKVPAGLGIFDLQDGKIYQRYMNDAFYHMLGTTRAERTAYHGENTLAAAHPDDIPTINAVVRRVLEGEDRLEMSYRLRMAEDRWFWIHFSGRVAERKPNFIRIYANYVDYNAVKQAEQLQEEQRVTLGAAMQAAKVLTWKYDCRTATITDTLTLGARYGLPKSVGGVPESLIAMGFIAPDSVENFRDFFTRVSTKAPAATEVRILENADGDTRWLNVVDTPVYDSYGAYLGSIGTCTDITVQKERELQYEEQLRLSTVALKDAAATASLNLTKNTITARMNENPAFRGFLKLNTADEVLADGQHFALNAEEAAKFEPVRSCAVLQAAFRQGTTHLEVVAHIKRDSSWVRATYDMLENPYTRDLELIFALYDVTASERAERVINRLLAVDYKSILLINTADGAAITYRDGLRNSSLGLIYENQEKAGSNAEGLANFFRLYALPGTADEIIRTNEMSYIRKQLETTPTYETMYTLLIKGQPERLRVLYTYLDDDESMLLSATQDVTEMYDRELKQKADLASALAAAEKANRAKTDFLSRVSHDMRTPLNGILGLTTLLKERVTDPTELRDLQQLQLSGGYLLNLINDTLDVSKIESGELKLHPVVCEGRAVFNNIVSLARPNWQAKNIRFNIHAENLPNAMLYMDVPRVEQIVMNLVGNAIKFTPEGGQIDFTFETLRVADGVSLDRVTIQDSGIGMSKEFLPHLFEPFSQEDNGRTSRTQGTGLGMTITKRIIEEMGGEITVESERGKGTTFRFTLPMQLATPEQVAAWKKTAEAGTAPAQSLEGRRVLLCEDHPLNAQIAERILCKKGMRIDHAENGAEGVKQFEQSPIGYYDVILMDIRMPVMDGLAAARAIRALPRTDAAEIPIVAMTANAFDEDIRQALDAGMNAHLGKPIETDKLFATLEKLLRQRKTPSRPTVLVVDDEEVNRAVMAAALAGEYTVLEAENGARALEILARNHGVSAVITDLQMPEMDGATLIRTLRAQPEHHRLVIIANTQYGDPEQEETLLALGADDFVYKPSTPKIIQNRVRNALR